MKGEALATVCPFAHRARTALLRLTAARRDPRAPGDPRDPSTPGAEAERPARRRQVQRPAGPPAPPGRLPRARGVHRGLHSVRGPDRGRRGEFRPPAAPPWGSICGRSLPPLPLQSLAPHASCLLDVFVPGAGPGSTSPVQCQGLPRRESDQRGMFLVTVCSVPRKRLECTVFPPGEHSPQNRALCRHRGTPHPVAPPLGPTVFAAPPRALLWKHSQGEASSQEKCAYTEWKVCMLRIRGAGGCPKPTPEV